MMYQVVLCCCLLFNVSCRNYEFKIIDGKGWELGIEVKNIIELIRNGHSRHKISNMLNIPKSTVIDVARKFFDTGSVENKPRSGRPAKMKERDYRGLKWLVKTQRRESQKNQNQSIIKARLKL